jgi:apolipoprotein N-acyltransferase
MRPAILAAGSGLLLAFSLAPFDVEWLGWFALVPLLVAARERRPLIALGLGLLTGVVCGLVHVGWHADAHGLQFAYLPFLWLAMLLGIVAAAGASFLLVAPGAKHQAPSETLAKRLAAWPGIEPGTWHLAPGAGLRWVAFVACAGVTAEWLSAFSPLPLNLAVCQYQARLLIQIAALTGIWGVSFLLWWSNAALAQAIFCRRLMTAPLALALALGYSARALAHIQRTSTSALRVAAVQECSSGETAGLAEHGEPGAEEGDREALTRRAVGRGARLVVWSEDCLGATFAPEARGDATADLARELKTHLVVGYSAPGPIKSWNCAALVAPDGRVKGVHCKTHLFLGERQIREAGSAARAFDTALGRVGLEICFDNCYTDVTRWLVRDGAQLIAVPNYDPPTPRGILHRLHAAMLPFRAVENRVPIVRADANGCSQIVDATGRVIGQSPLYLPDVLVGDVALGDGTETLFTRVGDLFAYLCLLIVALGSLTTVCSRQKAQHKSRG